MAGQYVLPVYIRAFNQLSAPMQAMQSSLSSFTEFADAANKKLTIFGDTTTKIGSYMKSVAVMGAGVFAAKSIADYDDALSKFRIIVDDLTDSQFENYKASIKQVAKATTASSVEVANAFENIAAIAPEFAATTKGISDMAQAAITLSRASGESLPQTAQELATTMQQYGLAADQANRVINSMAAGQAAGAASVQNITEAMKNFGATARGANISIEQSVALVEALASRGLIGEEAGTGIKSAITHLQAKRIGYQSGVFNISDALAEANKKLASFHTEMQKDAYIQSLFGIHQINTGRTILATADTFAELTGKVTGTTEAYKQAEIQQKSFYAILNRIKNAFVTYITTNKEFEAAMENLKSVLVFISKHVNTILKLVEAFFILKAAIWGATVAMRAYEIAVTIAKFAQGALAVATGTLNGELLAMPLYARGAAAGLMVMNGTAGILLQTLGKVAALLAIITYRKEIMNFADDNMLKYNLMTGNTDALKASMERLYIKNSDVARKMIEANPGYNVPGLDKSFATIDSARAGFNVHLQGDNDEFLQNMIMKREQAKSDSAYNANVAQENKLKVEITAPEGYGVKTSSSSSSVMPTTFQTYTR